MKARVLGCLLLLLGSAWRFGPGEPHDSVESRWSRGHSVGYWLAKLEETDLDPQTAGAAADALGELGPRAKAAVPALARALENKQIPRHAVLQALGNIGPNAAAAIPVLIPLLQGPREYSLNGLAGRAVPPLPCEPDSRTREVLVRIGPAAVSALTDALDSPDPMLRVNAAWALWNIDRKTEIVLPVLASLLNEKTRYSDDSLVRSEAATVLSEIGALKPEAVLPILAAGLGSHRVVYHSILGLGTLAPKQPRAIDLLFEVFIGKNETYSVLAGDELNRFGKPVVAKLLELLTAQEPYLRRRAARLLARMRIDDYATELAPLWAVATDPDAEVREAASWVPDYRRDLEARRDCRGQNPGGPPTR